MLVLLKQFKNSLPSEIIICMQAFIPKIGECFLLVISSGNVHGNIFFKTVIRKNKRWLYTLNKKKSNNCDICFGNFYNKRVQNYYKIPPQKGGRVI